MTIPEAGSVDRMRVVVAEDDASQRGLLSTILAGQGCEVLQAEDGVQALDMLGEESDVDLLVTDIEMPNLDGLGLLHALGEIGVEMPVIVVTSHGDQDVLVELIRLGCSDFISKPFKATDVGRKVNEVMDKWRRQQRKRGLDGSLRSQQGRLRRMAENYRQEYVSLRGEMERAKAVYQDITQVCTDTTPLKIVLRNRPCHELGGDYFNLLETGGAVGLLLADVAGHDLAASYHAVLIKAVFERHFKTGADVEALFHVLNRELYDKGRNERMVTAAMLRLDTNSWRGEAACAGHPAVLRIRDGKPTAPLNGSGSVLGVQEVLYLEKKVFDFKPKDRFYLHTDGVPNVFSVQGSSGRRERLGEERLMRWLFETQGLELEEQVETVWNRVLEFCRSKPDDDMLFVGVEIP